MLDTLGITKYVDTISLIQTTVKSCARVLGDELRIGLSTRFEQKDVSAGISGAQVNVAKYTGSDTRLGTIED